MAAAGADGLFIDMEHGAVDYGTAHSMIAATQGTDCAPLVRVAANDPAQVKRALDLGAEGICFPLIRTVEDARRAVASLRYPPGGVRGFGPFIAHFRWQTDMQGYAAAVEDQIVCILLIETREAVENIEQICEVEGIDLLVTAMFDLTTDFGVMGKYDHPDIKNAVQRVEKAAFSRGIPLSSNALDAQMAADLFARGYWGIAGFDILWFKARTAELKSWAES